MTLDTPSVVAASICWLSRQPGLPEIPALRAAVVQRHQLACDWCDYEADDLIRLIQEGMTDHVSVGLFERMPQREQRRLVEAAQGQRELV